MDVEVRVGARRHEPRRAAPPVGVRGFFRSLGPGVVAGAADDDPSGIATYSVAGAQFGTALLWMALFTWPLMIAVQSMCAAVLNGLLAPFLLVGILIAASDRVLMHEQPSSRRSQVVVAATALVMFVADIGMFVF